MAFLLSAIIFTMLAASAPITRSADQICLSADFSLTMRVLGDGPWVTLNAIESGQKDTLYLVGERLSFYQGERVGQNGKSGNASLNVHVSKRPDACGDVANGTYGISAPDVGPLYGITTPVLATKDSPWPHFYVSDDYQIEPKKTDAAQLWFACKQLIRDTEYYVLSWGMYNENGTAPEGCDATNVVQKFNIPCAEGQS